MQGRQLNILKAAMPYMAARYRKPVHVIIQAQELSDYIVTENDDPDVEAYEFDSIGNIEGMIEDIKPYCTSDEIDMFNNIISFIRTRRMFRNYMTYMASGGDNNMMSFLMSQLTPDQRNTYEKMSAMFSEQ